MNLQQPSQLIRSLQANKRQILVTYGTSLTSDSAWVGHVQQALDAKYPHLLTVINHGKGAMWSKWGVDNLDQRVIHEHPDTVMIEFAINDSFLEYKTSVEEARVNLNNMIIRILAASQGTEIILMTMNNPTAIHLERRPNYKFYYQMYREVAQERKLRLIDMEPIWDNIYKTDHALFSKYVPDGIHPGPEGSQKVTTPAVLAGLGF